MTAYALTHSTSWASGIVGAPVTDWRNYDTVYTERYMKIPRNNPGGYRETAPRFAAAKLHGKMLLIHGGIDDNVHRQNSEQFAYELQRLGKPFEMMIYPRQRHGFTDARLNRHLRQLMFDFIMRTVGGRDASARGERIPLSTHVSFLGSLQSGNTVIAAELRPPRAELGSAEGMDAWIDTYHAVTRAHAPGCRGVPHRRRGRHPGREQPAASRHQSRARPAARPRRAVPDDEAFAGFLSELCRTGVAARVSGAGRPRRRSDARASRAASTTRGSCATRSGCASRVCSSGAGRIRTPIPSRQVDYLVHDNLNADFYLTQVVSHLDSAPVARFVEETRRRGLDRLPGMFGVFYYRSANPADARAAEPLSAGSGRGARRRVRSGRVARRCLRAHAARDDRCRRAALLHQQPAAGPRLRHAQRHPRPRRRPGLKVRLKPDTTYARTTIATP